MSKEIFKFINGKFVISEGYGSVKKNKTVEEGELQDVADDIKNTESNLDAERRASLDQKYGIKQPNFTQTTQSASQQPSQPENSPELTQQTTSTQQSEPVQNNQSNTPADISTFAGFLQSAGISPIEIEATADAVEQWANSKNIKLDKQQLLRGIENVTPERQVAAESKYFYPRVQKTFIRHPSLIPAGYHR